MFEISLVLRNVPPTDSSPADVSPTDISPILAKNDDSCLWHFLNNYILTRVMRREIKSTLG